MDGIVSAPMDGISNAAFTHTVDKAEAERKVAAWSERHKPIKKQENTAPAPAEPVIPTGTPVDQLQKRLALLQPHDMI